MARSAVINVTFRTGSDGKVNKKIKPDKPLASRGGEFVWVVSNLTAAKLVVSLRKFEPPDFLQFDPDSSVEVPPTKKKTILATVVDDDSNNIPVAYEVWADDVRIDPDLIIEGDGTNPPPEKEKKPKGKKKQKGGVKKGGKKKAKKR
jgi:hypothetical protein